MTWYEFFKKNEKEINIIEDNIMQDVFNGENILPDWIDWYFAFELCPLDNTKVVILGQDPYPEENKATGMAFSVPAGINPPRSLKTIFREIERDLQISMPKNYGNLIPWAKQGVLLLNSCLTVQEGIPGSHIDFIGWEPFTDKIIKFLSDRGGIAFLLWGKQARKKVSLIDENKNLILEAPHPAQPNKNGSFKGCGHFSLTNAYLRGIDKEPINWRLK